MTWAPDGHSSKRKCLFEFMPPVLSRDSLKLGILG